jgi:hypothetical protein
LALVAAFFLLIVALASRKESVRGKATRGYVVQNKPGDKP